MSFLNTPTTFFWYGVLESMHGEGNAELLAYAKATIFDAATSAGREQCKAAEWLLQRPGLAGTKEYNAKAWHFATWFVLSGRAATITDGVPNETGALEISADGISVNRGKLPKTRAARKASRPNKSGGNWAPF